MCHYGKYFENACFNKTTNFNLFHCMSWPHELIEGASDTSYLNGNIKMTCHVFYTWICCIQGTLSILFSRYFIFTIDKHKYTSAYIYCSDFENKFSWFILVPLHIAAGPFQSSFEPFMVLFTLQVYIKPSKMDILSFGHTRSRDHRIARLVTNLGDVRLVATTKDQF